MTNDEIERKTKSNIESDQIGRELTLRQLSFEYAWNFFSVHAGQRMQTVYFYFIAVAFLVGGYIKAIESELNGIAIVISLYGVIASFAFYRIERRVRSLIHAAEKALRKIEDDLADSSGMEEIKILLHVESSSKDSWPYSKVFKVLYISTGFAFLGGLTYATIIHLSNLLVEEINIPLITILSFLSLLSYSYILLTTRRKESKNWLEISKVVSVLIAILSACFIAIFYIIMNC